MSKSKKTLLCTRDFVELLQENGEVWQLDDPVDPNLELAHIQREVCKRKGPAILFTNVKGTRFPVATNLYGSEKRIELAFGQEPGKFIETLADTVMNLMPPNFKKIWQAKSLIPQGLKLGVKNRKSGAVLNNRIDPVDLTQLPQIKSWPDDGGAFVTLPLVYTESPVSGKGNLGMYRIQMFDRNHAGMHIQIHRGGGFHYYEAEKMGKALPARIFVGGPPALTIAAVAPLPEDITELMFASLLMGKKLDVGVPDDLGIRMVMDADFSIQGKIPPFKRRKEGPFGDHYGYYSLEHDYPFLEVESINCRKDAIWPATIVGRPPQEDHYIAEYLQDLLEPLFPMVMPTVKKVWAFEESGVHSMAGAIVKNRYPKEAFTAALRILSEGHLSLTKFLIVTDQDCNVKDFRALFLKVLERADFMTDLFVFSNISQDSLDYTDSRENEGSKGILMGIGPKRFDLKESWSGSFRNSALGEAELFCPGALCVKGTPYSLNPALAEELVQETSINDFRMVFLVDDPKEACKSSEDFIWHIFTRFDPASDIYGKSETVRLHVGITGTVVIDCRMKPWYPSVLIENPDVTKAVEEKWGSMIDRVCR